MTEGEEIHIDMDDDTSEPLGPWCWCDVEHGMEEIDSGVCDACGKLIMESD